jgi:hypothetical protein
MEDHRQMIAKADIVNRATILIGGKELLEAWVKLDPNYRAPRRKRTQPGNRV